MSSLDKICYYKGVKIIGAETSARNRYIWRIRVPGYLNRAYDSLAEAKQAVNAAIAKATNQS